jgi:hypothetical protein
LCCHQVTDKDKARVLTRALIKKGENMAEIKKGENTPEIKKSEQRPKKMVLLKPLCFRKVVINGQYLYEYVMKAGSEVKEPELIAYAEKNYPTYFEWA